MYAGVNLHKKPRPCLQGSQISQTIDRFNKEKPGLTSTIVPAIQIVQHDCLQMELYKTYHGL